MPADPPEGTIPILDPPAYMLAAIVTAPVYGPDPVPATVNAVPKEVEPAV